MQTYLYNIHVHVVTTIQTRFAGFCLFPSFPHIKDLTSGQLDQILCPCSLSVMDRLIIRMCDAVVRIGMNAVLI